MAEKDKELIENIEKQEYKYGFTSDIETETIPRGLVCHSHCLTDISSCHSHLSIVTG